MPTPTSRLEFVSLFSGAGGLDLGLEYAGWTCLYAADNEPSAVKSLQRNQESGFAPQATIEVADVRKLSGKEILGKAGRNKGDIPLMAGGPPCQSWSSAGHQKGFEDPRGVLFRDFLRLSDECGCRLIVFENVRGLLTARGPNGVPGEALEVIRREMLDYGYSSSVSLINAADFGVPQRRNRLIIYGYRDIAEPKFPSPTHGKSDVGELNLLKPWRTLADVLDQIGNLAPEEIIRPSQSIAQRLKGLMPGEGIKSEGKKETTRPGGHWGYLQGGFVADPSVPARTVTASSQQDWIRLADGTYRRLCPRECAVIQSFPDGWHFDGTNAKKYRQIGNAVPPLLAKALGEELALAVQRGRPARCKQPPHHLPLPKRLAEAIEYTKKEERRNGESRRAAPKRRRERLVS